MRLIAAAAAAMIVAAPAIAQTGSQDGGLTEEQVRRFFEAAAPEAERLAEAGDWRGLHSFGARHLAEDAQIAVRGTLVAPGGPVMSFEASLDRETIERFGQMAEAGPAQVGPRSIEDFSLVAHVQNVTTLPNGEAAAQVAFHESGTIAVPAPEGGGQAEDGSGGAGAAGPPETERLVFETTTLCSLRLAAGGNGKDVVVRMGACQSATTLG